jgi:hypothetical protein
MPRDVPRDAPDPDAPMPDRCPMPDGPRCPMPPRCPRQMIGNPTLTDAILDRLVNNAYRINLKGESMRKKKS